MKPENSNNTPQQEKKIVSRFEYAIMQAVKIPGIEKYRPITAEEERKRFEDKCDDFFNQIKCKS